MREEESDREWYAQVVIPAIAGLDVTLPRRELIRRCVEAGCLVTCGERGALFLCGADGQTLESYATAGPAVEPFTCDVRKGIAGACFLSRSPIIVADARQDPRFNPEIDHRTHYETRSIVAVPLVNSDGHALGVIESISSKLHRFSEEDAKLLSILGPYVLNAIERQGMIARLTHEPSAILPADIGLLGESEALRRAFDLAAQVAASDANAFVTGESGTGKTRLARFIHLASSRRARQFVLVPCAAIAATLAESELFGHVKGAFTGASYDKVGYVERADGGTLFLDEAPDMAELVQPKMLQMAEDGTYYRVGDPAPRKANVRIIAASDRLYDPRSGEMRLLEPLWHRVSTFTIEMPPLRGCDNDAYLIFVHGVRRRLGDDVRIAPEVREFCARQTWPGNVRDVEAMVEHAALFCRGGKEVRVEHIRGALKPLPGVSPRLPPWLLGERLPVCRARLDRERVRISMRVHGGIMSRVEKDLGISRREVGRIVREIEQEDRVKRGAS